MTSLKDLIRNSDDIKVQDDVEIPEWAPNVKFRVTGLPSKDWEQYQNRMSKMTKKDESSGLEMSIHSNRAEIVAKALRDQDSGELVFPDLKEGIAILSKKNTGLVTGLFVLVRHLSGEDRDFRQKVAEAASDFGDGQS